jgi:hypothetical protein
MAGIAWKASYMAVDHSGPPRAMHDDDRTTSAAKDALSER